jgi:hypothetical protein
MYQCGSFPHGLHPLILAPFGTLPTRLVSGSLSPPQPCPQPWILSPSFPPKFTSNNLASWDCLPLSFAPEAYSSMLYHHGLQYPWPCLAGLGHPPSRVRPSQACHPWDTSPGAWPPLRFAPPASPLLTRPATHWALQPRPSPACLLPAF